MSKTNPKRRKSSRQSWAANSGYIDDTNVFQDGVQIMPMEVIYTGSPVEDGNDDLDDDALSEGSEDSGIESNTDVTFNKKPKRRRGTWLATTFMKKVCVKFVQDPAPDSPSNACFCGHSQAMHVTVPHQFTASKQAQSLSRNTTLNTPTAVLPYQDPDLPAPPADAAGDCTAEWNAEEHLGEFPTDAFGEIKFSGVCNRVCHSKFVRLSDGTDMSLILNLLTKYWKLPKPQLVISLTGGGRSFKLNAKDEETFSRGIIKAAWTTDAWIITSGFNAGVPKITGEAVQASYTREWITSGKNAKKGQEQSKLKCIGLTPWGYVDGSHQLLSRTGKGSYPAEYKVNPVVMKGRPVPLNPDHTHFILIDNGLRGEPAYGGEIIMRSMIEEALAAPTEANGLGLPVVMVVLEGGVDTLQNVKYAVLRGVPTVVCDGSGRAADIIAFAHNHAEGEDESRTVSAKNCETLRSKLHSAFKIDLDSDKMTKLIEDIVICIKVKKLITVFQMMDKGESAGLDYAILGALLKAQAAKSTYQLALALSWNRPDVAEWNIFVDSQHWTRGSLDPFIMQSLIHNQVDFIRLFLKKGVVMKDFLTVSRLRKLYNSLGYQHTLRLFVAMVNNTKVNKPIYLHHISHLIQRLMGVHRNKLYALDKPFSCGTCKESVGLVALSSTLAGSLLTQQVQEELLNSESDMSMTSGSSLKLGMIELANPGLHFKCPFWELFLFSVLACRMDMAEFFLEYIDDAVCGGIVASTILKGMASLSKDPDDILEAEKNAKHFEKLAVSVIDECYKTDEVLAETIIRCPNKHWGGKNVLMMAATSDNKAFIAHSCTQSLVRKQWLGGMRTTALYVCLAILCPILIFRIKFPDLQNDPGGCFKELRRLRIFYTAPVTKFVSFVLSYIVFLMLYSYVMLATFGDRPSISEMALFGWIVTMIIEEIRQAVIPGKDESLRERFCGWSSSEWNIMDAITAIIAMAAFGSHWFSATHEWSKAFYAINCFLYYSRVLRLFSVSEKLGPKMVMIRKMVFEMVLFLCILLVFLLGYGVASNILLYPHLDIGWDSVANTVYMPYFQIYGELFLDTINSDSEMNNSCDPAEADCAQHHVLLPFMLGVYLLLGNVLLLNLLIAIFSSIFDEVQTNSLEIWKFEQYFLVDEFDDRPTLPPPFIIVEHALKALRWVWRKTFKCCMKDVDNVQYLYKKAKRVLRSFEKDCAANYRRKKAEEKDITTPERLNQLERRLKELNNQAERTKEELQKKLEQIQQLIQDGFFMPPPKEPPENL